jgi:hypothetical protein
MLLLHYYWDLVQYHLATNGTTALANLRRVSLRKDYDVLGSLSLILHFAVATISSRTSCQNNVCLYASYRYAFVCNVFVSKNACEAVHILEELTCLLVPTSYIVMLQRI